MRRLVSSGVVLAVVVSGLALYSVRSHQVALESASPLSGNVKAKANEAVGTTGVAGKTGTAPAAQSGSGLPSNIAVMTGDGQVHHVALSLFSTKTSFPGPGHANGNGDTVRGTRTEEFQFAAQGDPLDAQGRAHLFVSNFIDANSPVDCLFVQGTHAFVGGPVAHPVVPGFTRYLLYAEDNDVADKDRSGVPDRITISIVSGGSRADCSDPALQAFLQSAALPITKGNLEADQER